jgi:hypothetical protein
MTHNYRNNKHICFSTARMVTYFFHKNENSSIESFRSTTPKYKSTGVKDRAELQ